jgi:hypothetical protein
LGLSKDRPSTDTSCARPLPGSSRATLRPEVATPRTRSALAVPPDFGGLLRASPRRSVAPCNRSWGSPRFRLNERENPKIQPVAQAFPSGALHTLQSLPLAVSRTASPRPLPSRGSARRLLAACMHAWWSRRIRRLRAFLRRRVRCHTQAFPPVRGPMLSWASLPFRALPSASASSPSALRGSRRPSDSVTVGIRSAAPSRSCSQGSGLARAARRIPPVSESTSSIRTSPRLPEGGHVEAGSPRFD